MTQNGALFDAEQEGGGSRLFDPGPERKAEPPAQARAGECPACNGLGCACEDLGIEAERLV